MVMKDYFIQFRDLESLLGFFHSVDLTESELARLPIKQVDGQYWVSSQAIPERIPAMEEDRIASIARLYPAGQVSWARIDPGLAGVFAKAPRLDTGNFTVLLKESTMLQPGQLSDREFVIATRNEEVMQEIVNLFFRLNHTNLRVLSLDETNEDFQHPYLIWVVGYGQGVPVPLTMREKLARQDWEIFLIVEKAPARQRWFIALDSDTMQPAGTPNFVAEDQYHERIVMVKGKTHLALEDQDFRPVLHYTRIKVDHLSRPAKGLYSIGRDRFEISLRLEPKEETAWELAYQGHQLDKKYESLSFQMDRIRKLMNKFSRFQDVQRHAYLYCYNLNSDDRNFRRIIMERPMAEKEGLSYYQCRINGLEEEVYRIVASRKLFEDGVDTRWNITQEYLPLDPRQYYYLHPEWFFAGIYIFVPLTYELVPYIDLTKPEHALELVRALFPTGYFSVGDEDPLTQVRRFIDQHIVLLTPNPEQPGSIMTTYIERSKIRPLLESLDHVNESMQGPAAKHEARIPDRTLDWITDELKVQLGEKLRNNYEKILAQGREVKLEAANYNWRLNQLRRQMDKRLQEGQQLLKEVNESVKSINVVRKMGSSLQKDYENLMFREKDLQLGQMKEMMYNARTQFSRLNVKLDQEEDFRQRVYARLLQKHMDSQANVMKIADDFEKLYKRIIREGK